MTKDRECQGKTLKVTVTWQLYNVEKLPLQGRAERISLDNLC